MRLTFINWVLAAAPIIVLLVLMLGFKRGARDAGTFALLTAIVVGFAVYGAGPRVVGLALGKGVFLTLDVLYIIWMALLFFHVANEAGAIQAIGTHLPHLTADRTIQLLLLGWLFVSFLQGVGGFGVPVAVVAPLLVGMGFNPIQAVVIASIGHGWAVTFGSLGTSFQALIASTGLPGFELAPESAILLGIGSIASGLLVAYIGTGLKDTLQKVHVVLILSAVMGVVQYLLATNGFWTLGATGGSLAGILVAVGFARVFYSNHTTDVADQVVADGATEQAESSSVQISIRAAIAAYVVLVVTIFGINLIPFLREVFNAVRVSVQFPEIVTTMGWVTPAEEGRRLSVFGHPGALLFYSSVITYIIYRRSDYYEEGSLKTIIRKVVKSAVKSSIGIAVMVGMAVVMSHAGMTNMLARGLSESVGPTLYPVVAPLIGTLGAFMTGSNTNSNVVFGALQRDTAELLGLSITTILAAQTAGASLGSVFAPAKVIVGCSTVGLAGQEGPVISRMLLYGLIPVVVIAVVTWLMIAIF